MQNTEYISAVQLEPELAGLFFKDIGEKIDINMFAQKKKDDKLAVIKLHKQVIDIISSMGFEKKGFEGYCPPQNGISKGQLKSFLDKFNSEKERVQRSFDKQRLIIDNDIKLSIESENNDENKEKLKALLKIHDISALEKKIKDIRKQERNKTDPDIDYKDYIKKLQKSLKESEIFKLQNDLMDLKRNFDSLISLIGTEEQTYDKIASAILNKLITKQKDFKVSSASEYKEDPRRNYGTPFGQAKPGKELYEWQKEVINSITDDKSVIVRGPTNGGKTFVGMSIIGFFISRSSNIAFILPTTYLAAQTYSNIINTFGSKCTINLLAGSLHIKSSSCPNVIVGTPESIWAWLRSHPNFTFDRMIVDEIHTISSPLSNRGIAIRNIISRCKRQFLGLSATIHDEDLEKLTKMMRENGINCENRKYDQRPIPLLNQRYSDGEIKDIKGKQDESLIPEINPKNTLKLIQKLKFSDRLPCLIFDESDSASWNQFVEFNNYLIFLDEEISPEWKILKEEIDVAIEKYNSAHNDAYQEYVSVYSENNHKKLNLLNGNYKFMATERQMLLNKSFIFAQNILKKASSKILDRKFDEYRVPVDESLRKRLKSFKIESEEFVYPIVVDILKSLELLKDTKDQDHNKRIDAIEPLSPYFQGVSPWIRFCDIAVTNNLTEMLRSDRRTDQRLHMLKMCTAESIKESDIEDLFRILERGARYGIVSLLPSLPNVIQIEILKLFNSKAINVVFTSRDMSMGVNFPVITSIVRCTTDRKMIPVDARVQAEGRAGRKGKCNVGYSIAWNIINDHMTEFPRLNIPEIDNNKGCYINDIAGTIEKLYTHYICRKDIASHYESIRDKFFKIIVNKTKLLTESEMKEIENDVHSDDDYREMSFSEQKSSEKIVKAQSNAKKLKERNLNDVWRSTCIDLIEKLEMSLGGNMHKANIIANFLCDSVIKGIDKLDLSIEQELIKEIEVKDKLTSIRILQNVVRYSSGDEFSNLLEELLESKSDFIESEDQIDIVMDAWEILKDCKEYSEVSNKRIIIYKLIELIDVYINSLQEIINYPISFMTNVLNIKSENFSKLSNVEKTSSVNSFKIHLIEFFKGICQAKYRCMKHLA